jgi:hypothetical protein
VAQGLQPRTDVKRWQALFLACIALGCRSAQLRGPGPGNPPAVGHPGSRVAEVPAGRNHPATYGWGSAYDPHTPGSRATPGHPFETGAIPPFPYWHPYWGRPMGAPPPVIDTPKK